jgi:uncharacterized protein YdeI (BOF family)
VKKIFLLCAVALAGLAWKAGARQQRFGNFTGAPKAAVEDVASRPAEFQGRTVALEGTIRAQCKAMGCYFFFRQGQAELRVDLAEIAMTAPMHEGGRAKVEGQLVPYNGGYQLWASAVEFE